MKRFFNFPAGLCNYFQDIDLRFPSASPCSPVPADVAPRLNRLADIRVVLWDIYGTLCGVPVGDLNDSLSQPQPEVHSIAAQTVIEEFSLAESLKKLSGFSGQSPEKILVALYYDLIAQSHQRSQDRGIEYPEVRINKIFEAILQCCVAASYQPPNAEPLDQLAYRVAYLYDTAFQNMTLYPGVAQCLNALNRSGMVQGIISNAQFYTPLRLRYLLRRELKNDRLELEDLFTEELVFFSYELGCSKPNSQAFQRAIEKFKARNITPDQVFFIGNDMLNDITVAQENGFKTMLFAADKTQTKLREDVPRCQSTRPDAIVTHANQIVNLIHHD